MKGIVDRIEGDMVVCELNGKIVDIPKTSFSERPQDGDVFEYEHGIASILYGETRKKDAHITSLFEKLKKK